MDYEMMRLGYKVLQNDLTITIEHDEGEMYALRHCI